MAIETHAWPIRALLLASCACLVGMFLGRPAAAATGGPDVYGYRWADSDEPDLEFNYEYAAGTLALGDDDFSVVAIGFDFEFYGSFFDHVTITSNGLAHFDGNTAPTHLNQALPYGQGLFIAPFWDDLDPTNGAIFFGASGEAPERVMVIEWWDVAHYADIGSASFEIKLYEADGAVEFIYADVLFGDELYDSGVSATVGIQDGFHGSALMRSHDEAVLVANYGVRFQPPPCYDRDWDGHRAEDCGGEDCDDNNPLIHPGAVDVGNGVDDDCDGAVDEDVVGDDDDTADDDTADDDTESDDDAASDDDDAEVEVDDDVAVASDHRLLLCACALDGALPTDGLTAGFIVLLPLVLCGRRWIPAHRRRGLSSRGGRGRRHGRREPVERG